MKLRYERIIIWNIVVDYKKKYMVLTYISQTLSTIQEQYRNIEEEISTNGYICSENMDR